MSVAFLAFASLKCWRFLSLLSLSFTIVARIVGLPLLPTAKVRKHCQLKMDIGMAAEQCAIPTGATEPRRDRKFNIPFIYSRNAERDRMFYPSHIVPALTFFSNALECPELRTTQHGSGAS
jgi:hypothetical protein